MATRQKILTMETAGDQLSSAAIGWGLIDSSRVAELGGGRVVLQAPRVGFAYASPLAAMADGWRVMGPPLAMGDNVHEWWLEQLVETHTGIRPLCRCGQ